MFCISSRVTVCRFHGSNPQDVPPPWPGALVLNPRMLATPAGENDERSVFDGGFFANPCIRPVGRTPGNPQSSTLWTLMSMMIRQSETVIELFETRAQTSPPTPMTARTTVGISGEVLCLQMRGSTARKRSFDEWQIFYDASWMMCRVRVTFCNTRDDACSGDAEKTLPFETFQKQIPSSERRTICQDTHCSS